MRPEQTSSPAAQHLPAAASGGTARPVPPVPIELSLAAGVGSAGAARAAVRAWMGGHVTEPCFTDALLVIGELVANSIRHAQAPAEAMIDVRAEMRADVVRLE